MGEIDPANAGKEAFVLEAIHKGHAEVHLAA
jgi:hypothetical protein